MSQSVGSAAGKRITVSLAVIAAVALLARAQPPPPSRGQSDEGRPRSTARGIASFIENLADLRVAEADDRVSSLPLDVVGEVDSSCAGTAYGALALKADVGGPAGIETVVASYAHGLLVVGAEGHTIGTAPGYPCFGSADDVEAIAVGKAWGEPAIALAVTTGGRRETMTWVGLYRIGRFGKLEATFSGVVEHSEDGVVRRGRITMLPGALIHREPSGEVVLWVFDPVPGVYIPYGLGRGEPHS